MGAFNATDQSAIAVRHLLCARALRDFGDGFVAILLPVYLLGLGLGPIQVGMVATAALLGSALLTLAVGFLGARHDHRRLLLAAASLMVATGVAFAAIDDYAILLVVAFAGTANPSAGSVSVFVPLEHAVLAREVVSNQRTKIFARYSLIGALAGAAGSLAAAAPELMAPLGLSQLTALRIMFILYAALGVIGGLFYGRIPKRQPTSEQRAHTALGPSRHIVYRLAALFSLDAFAGGFVVQSLLALWLFERFDLSLAQAGIFFFWSGVLSAFSFPVAAWLSRRIGLINTMVFTHIPASIALDPRGVCTDAVRCAGPAAGARCVVADGCADALLLRHGGRHRSRARRRRKLDVGAAQPGSRSQPDARRHADGRLVPRLAAGDLRRPQDRLRPAAAHPVPAREAAGGKVTDDDDLGRGDR